MKFMSILRCALVTTTAHTQEPTGPLNKIKGSNTISLGHQQLVR